MDLGGGKYAAFEEEWLLDGSPLQPYRRTINRRDIATAASPLALTSASVFVYAVPVQVGDVFSFVTFLAKTATLTPTHSWVALYNGVGPTAALLGQSTDATGGFAVGTNKIALASAVSNIGTQGIPQGPSTPAVVPAGPAVWGVALYNTGGTGATLDGMPGGGTAGEIAITGQPAMASSGTLAATATAPALLSGLGTYAALIGGVPYVVLSRS